MNRMHSAGVVLILFVLLSLCFLNGHLSNVIQRRYDQMIYNPVSNDEENKSRLPEKLQFTIKDTISATMNNMFSTSDVRYSTSSTKRMFSTKDLANVTPSKPKSKQIEIPSLTKRKFENKEISDPKVPVPRNEIMLFGYLRGGTTFLGTLLGQRPDTFYYYEPLIKYGRFSYYKKDGACSMIRPYKCWGRGSRRAIRRLKKVYNCDHSNVSPNNIAQSTKNHFGEWHTELESQYGHNERSEDMYLEELDKKCRGSSNVVAKVARISMDMATDLLSSRPNLKIVYLIRDPRAVILSRIKAFHIRNKPGWSKSLCLKMKKDYNEALQLLKVFPNRISILFYEDFVSRPETQLRQLHKFAGLSFSKEDEEKAMGLMLPASTNSEPNNHWSVVKSRGSVYTSTIWRKTIPNSVVNIVTRECESTLKLLKYKLFADEKELRNLKISAFSGKSIIPE